MDRIEEIKAQGELRAQLRKGVNRLRQEGAEALAFSLDHDRCGRKYAAADVVNRYTQHVTKLIGTDAFPTDEVLFMIEITKLSGVAMGWASVAYSPEQLAAIESLIAGGWLKQVREYFSPTRTVVFYTVDFAYESLDRSNG